MERAELGLVLTGGPASLLKVDPKCGNVLPHARCGVPKTPHASELRASAGEHGERGVRRGSAVWCAGQIGQLRIWGQEGSQLLRRESKGVPKLHLCFWKWRGCGSEGQCEGQSA